jgi:ABC-type branched-subunit amino acid transport system substrate-binding protein
MRRHFTRLMAVVIAMSTMAISTVVMTAGTQTSASAASTTTNSTNCSGTAAKGTPLQFGSIITLTGPVAFVANEQGLKAAVSCINASGGIGGHPIQISYCDDQASPTTADSCARSFSGKLAVIGNEGNGVDQSTYNIMAANNQAAIPTSVLGTADTTATNSFPPFGGAISEALGIAKTMAKDKNNKVAILPVAVAAGTLMANAICSTLKSGVKNAACSISPVQPTATDLSPNVSAATANGNPDAIASLIPATQCASMMSTIQTAGLTGKLGQYYSGTCFDPSVASTAGAAANSTSYPVETYSPLVASNSSKPDVKMFVNAMKRYQPSAGLGVISQQAFAVPYLMKSAIQAIGVNNVSSKAILNWLKTAKNVPVVGAPGTFTYGAAKRTQTPQLSQGTVQMVTRKNGKYVAVGTPVNGLP